MRLTTVKHFLLVLFCVFSFACVAKESQHAIQTTDTRAASENYSGPRAKVAVGKVVNRSAYLTGIFSDGNDRLGAQATQMLTMHLDRSGRFTVLDRQNLEESKREAAFNNSKQAILGAKYLVSGVVTEFGRKETGSVGLGGLISKSKQQVMYAKISISVVDPVSSQVLKSFAGAGEYQLSSSEALGFGSRAGYDGTLADKVLDLAIREAIDKLSRAYENKEF